MGEGRGGGTIGSGAIFFCEAGVFKTPASPKKIAGLITSFFGGNRTPKLQNSDFETTIKQGLSPTTTPMFQSMSEIKSRKMNLENKCAMKARENN